MTVTPALLVFNRKLFPKFRYLVAYFLVKISLLLLLLRVLLASRISDQWTPEEKSIRKSQLTPGVSQFFKNYSNFLHLYLTIQRRRLIPIFKENLIIHLFFWPKTHFDSLNIDRVGQILKLSSVSSIPP